MTLLSDAATRPIRVLIADDHALYRQSLGQMCRQKGGFTVVGEAENGQEAVALAAQLQPDVVLLDINMPVLDGLSAAELILQQHPNSRIILLTIHQQDEIVAQATQLGVQEFLLKDVDPQILVDTIKAVYHGK
jgi:DNA-binding NarL/FixJ family response regulator